LATTTDESDAETQPLSTLRGSSVQVDGQKVGRAVVAFTAVALAVLSVTFLVVGIHKNSQINELRDHGVSVNVKISGCLGIISGSGSNVSGYMCRGSLTSDGRLYNEPIGGTTAFFTRGSTIRAVTVPGDPALLFTPGSVHRQHASASVFIVPAVLFVAFVLFVVFALRLQRRSGSRTP
jgi:hypothetical protein